MKIVDIQKHISKNLSTSFGKLDREELVACLNHYQKLQVIYIDGDENVLFL
jgi:hypothetical protein